jgi:hypothetical protein
MRWGFRFVCSPRIHLGLALGKVDRQIDHHRVHVLADWRLEPPTDRRPDHSKGDRTSEDKLREVIRAYNYLKQAGLA